MIEPAEAARALEDEGLTGWLLYDFDGLDPLARRAAGLEGRLLTRRWFCLLRRDGAPRWLVHAIERAVFADRPGEVHTYAGRRELEAGLRSLLAGHERVAMSYSPQANVPTVSRLDAGTFELVSRAGGVEIVSAGDLVQRLLAPWPPGGLEAHERAAACLEAAVRESWRRIGTRLGADSAPTECEVQRWLVDAMEAAGLETNHPPIVAVDAHAADAHFAPAPSHDRPIAPGSLLLIDLWGREPGPAGIYADITLMAWVGADEPPTEIERAWRAVRDAREAALALVCERARAGRPVAGYEADRAARAVIEAAGHGQHFIHRTGHSLGPQDHWIGAHLDDYETHDERRLLPGTGFTIEPGIYVPGAFGIRSEIDVFWHPERGPQATTWRQQELARIGG